MSSPVRLMLSQIPSEMSGNVTNVVFRNSTCFGTTNGLRIKSTRGRGGLIANITYENFVMDSVDEAIQINLQYTNASATNASATPVLRDIFITNLTSTNTIANSGEFICLPESPCLNINLTNVSITGASVFTCQYAYGTGANVVPKSCLLP